MDRTVLTSMSAEEFQRLIGETIEIALDRQKPAPVPAETKVIQNDLYTREQVAALLHLSYVTLRKLEIEGTLIPVRAGRRVLYRSVDIERFLDRKGGR